MGLADLYLRTLNLIGNATNFGLGMSAVRHLSEVYEKEKNTDPDHSPGVFQQIRLIRTWTLLTALLGLGVCFCLSPLISLAAVGSTHHATIFFVLSPIVLFSTLMGGEMAILKGVRRLKRLAFASACGAVATLLVSAPLYFFFGMRGIVPVLLLTSALVFGFNLFQTTRLYPYKVGPFKPLFLKEGFPLLRLGTAYLIAGVMTTGAEMLIRAVLMRSVHGAVTVGYYAAGFTLTVSYARMVLVAMDADYFPRLSAITNNRREMNVTINRQINTLIVLMAPFLTVFCLALPLIVRLLYTSDFLTIIPMVLCAAPFMFFKAICTPIAYLPLARGDSFRYMTMELVYDVVFCTSVILGYHFYGLIGAGLALSACNLFDLVLVFSVYRHCYGYRMNAATASRCLLLFLLLAGGLFSAAQPQISTRVALGTCCLLLTFPVVWPVLKHIKK